MRLSFFWPAGSRVPPLEVAGLVFLRHDCVPVVSGAQIAQMTTPWSQTFGMPKPARSPCSQKESSPTKAKPEIPQERLAAGSGACTSAAPTGMSIETNTQSAERIERRWQGRIPGERGGERGVGPICTSAPCSEKRSCPRSPPVNDMTAQPGAHERKPFTIGAELHRPVVHRYTPRPQEFRAIVVTRESTSRIAYAQWGSKSGHGTSSSATNACSCRRDRGAVGGSQLQVGKWKWRHIEAGGAGAGRWGGAWGG